MDKLVLFIAVWSLSHAAYTSRMASMSRFRGPSAFRPGVVLQRAPYPPRFMPVHRGPIVVYRNMPHRYSMKPMSPVVSRNVFGIPWKTTARMPVPVTAEYDYAASQPVIRSDGAIHTIPAPNLSLAEKPIVVADVGVPGAPEAHASEAVKPTYEVTENNGETQTVKQPSKSTAPAGFVNSNADIYNVHNDAKQFSPDYVYPAAIAPQEFSVQRFNGLPSHQDLIQSGAEGLILPPDTFYQSDPLFLEKLQNQLLQKYPAVEFIPYTPTQMPSQIQFQPTPFYFDEPVMKQQPMSFVVSDSRNIVQRQTHEGTAENLQQPSTASNVTEVISASSEVATTAAAEVTTNLAEVEDITNSSKIGDNKSAVNRTDPMYYAQLGPSIANITPIGFHLNSNGKTSSETTVQPTTQSLDTKKPESNEISKEYNNFAEFTFEKPAESVNIAYAIVRASDEEPKVHNKSSKTGQLVEASSLSSLTKEFMKSRALSSRQSNRTVTQRRSADAVAEDAVKAKIPARSKLTFDDRTGEPVLRVYASYADSPARKEEITSKLANLQHLREAITKRQERVDQIDAATVNNLATDINQFGMKIKAKNMDRVHILDEFN